MNRDAVASLVLVSQALGALFLLNAAYQLAAVLFHAAVLRLRRGRRLYLAADSPRWAVITGASLGIGRGLAIALAARGWNLVLLAAEQSWLDLLAADLERQHGISVLAISADLSRADECNRVVAAVGDDRPIALLVHNLGITLESPVCFADMTIDDITRIMRVNTVSLLRLTRAFLPQICEAAAASPDYPGGVLSVSSLGTAMPGNWLSVYTSSKQAGRYLTLALGAEYPHVRFQVARCGLVLTERVYALTTKSERGVGVSVHAQADAMLRNFPDGPRDIVPVVSAALQKAAGQLIPAWVFAWLFHRQWKAAHQRLAKRRAVHGAPVLTPGVFGEETPLSLSE